MGDTTVYTFCETPRGEFHLYNVYLEGRLFVRTMQDGCLYILGDTSRRIPPSSVSLQIPGSCVWKHSLPSQPAFFSPRDLPPNFLAHKKVCSRERRVVTQRGGLRSAFRVPKHPLHFLPSLSLSAPPPRLACAENSTAASGENNQLVPF